jgi:hypothetical protein
MADENQMVVTRDDFRARADKISARVVSERKGVSYSDTPSDQTPIAKYVLEQISRQTTDDMLSSETILQMTPDTKRAMFILAGLITCPNGGQRVKLNYLLGDNGNYQDDENGNGRRVLDKVADFFTNTLDLNATQFDRVMRIISTQGAEAIMIIPDSAIDTLINDGKEVGLESMRKSGVFNRPDAKSSYALPPLGFLGSPVAKETQEVGLESAFRTSTTAPYDPVVNFGTETKDVTPMLKIIDNPNILRMPDILAHNSDIKSIVALERAQGKTPLAKKLHQNYYKRRDYKSNPVIAIPSPERWKPSGRPKLVIAPPGSVINVFYPGDPTRRIGSYVLLDSKGYPLQRQLESDAYRDLTKASSGKNNANDGGSTQILSKVQQKFAGSGYGKPAGGSVSDIISGLSKQLEGEFRKRLEHGVYGQSFSIEVDDVMARIFAARALQQKETYALFVPDELFCYMAYDYDHNGLGVSLVSQSKLMGTIRSVLFFANLLGELSNVIRQKELRVQFDERDPRPGRTLETVLNEVVAKLNGSAELFSFNGPSDIITGLQRFGLSVKLENMDVPGMPKMNVELEEKRRDIQPIDTTLMELTRKQQMMEWGLSPETVDQSFGAQFAVQISRENEITARMISRLVTLTAQHNKEFITKYIQQDEELLKELLAEIDVPANKRTVVKTTAGDEVATSNDDDAYKLGVIEEVLRVMVITPPEPDQNELEVTSENVENFMKVIDKVVDVIFGDTLRNTLDNDGGKYTQMLSEQIKAAMLKDYLRLNNGIPGFVSKILDPERLNDLLSNEIEGMVGYLDIAKDAIKQIKAADMKVQTAGEDAEAEVKRKAEERRAEEEAKRNPPTPPDVEAGPGADEDTDNLDLPPDLGENDLELPPE